MRPEAERVMVPERVAPEAGEVIETLGGVESGPPPFFFGAVTPLHPLTHRANPKPSASRGLLIHLSTGLVSRPWVELFP